MPALDLLAVALLIAGNAFFVIAEYALVTARRSALQSIGGAGARRALALMDDPTRFIGTVQIGITALGILLGALGEPVFTELVDGALPSWMSFAFGFLVVTYLSVAFGELVPKALALHAAERVAIAVSAPISFFSVIFRPAVWFLQISARLILRPLGVDAVSAGERPVSREELRGVLVEAEESGTLAAEEEDMLSGVIDLRLREAGDIMRPWQDVDVVRLDVPVGEALDGMLSAAHTRFPAVRGDADVAGVVHARDAWLAWRDARDAEPDLAAVVRPAVLVPATVRVDVLLRTLRRQRQQLAVVLGEYGRPEGIVTIEDILEEIVGEIEDEFDELDERFEQLDEHTWRVDGSASISDFNRHAGADLDHARARSVGGLVFAHFGRLPAVGEGFTDRGWTLTVEGLSGQRVGMVRLERAAQATA